MRAIFHADRKWGIGKDNALMFSLPLDMRFFRETTRGKVVVMGRNTLRSLPDGKPLKGRVNIVLSFAETFEGVVNVHSLSETLSAVAAYPEEDVFVIGGASVYRLLLPYCSEVLVTKVDADGGADVFVPDLDADPAFELVQESAPISDGGYSLKFCTYRNRNVEKF